MEKADIECEEPFERAVAAFQAVRRAEARGIIENPRPEGLTQHAYSSSSSTPALAALAAATILSACNCGT